MKKLLREVARKLLARPVKAVAHRFGYEITRLDPIGRKNGFQLYGYKGPDGQFDYEKYKQVQTAGNREKLGQIWALEENIAFLADYLTKRLGRVRFGLCHGTRQGKEQEWFKKYLGCDVLGTEISDTAEQFPHTIRWDFHEVKPEWIGAADFVYSNSFDHAYDPERCLDAWMSCVREGGVCVIEHSNVDEFATELDPFGADISLMPYLVLTWGKGQYCVREIIDAPAKNPLLDYVRFLIVQKL